MYLSGVSTWCASPLSCSSRALCSVGCDVGCHLGGATCPAPSPPGIRPGSAPTFCSRRLLHPLSLAGSAHLPTCLCALACLVGIWQWRVGLSVYQSTKSQNTAALLDFNLHLFPQTALPSPQ